MSGLVPFKKRLADDGRTLVPCPSEAETVRVARELSAGGLTLRAISAQLAAAVHVGRSGRPFGPQSVANMLRAG